jgi:hypothetical protein
MLLDEDPQPVRSVAARPLAERNSSLCHGVTAAAPFTAAECSHNARSPWRSALHADIIGRRSGLAMNFDEIDRHTSAGVPRTWWVRPAVSGFLGAMALLALFAAVFAVLYACTMLGPAVECEDDEGHVNPVCDVP